MTQKFAPNGTVIPVTKVVAGPCVVTQVKTADNDGYVAVQLRFGSKRKASKPVSGHLKNLGIFRYLREFRLTPEQVQSLEVGNRITAGIFQPGDVIHVTGASKGKGFQGVVKRHGFHGSPASHGHKDQLRMPGSAGATGTQHVLKGKRGPGRMGGGQVTVTNLEVVEVDAQKNELFIKGAVPGAIGNLLLIAGDGDFVIQADMPSTEALVTPEVSEAEKPAAESIETPVEKSASEPTQEPAEPSTKKETEPTQTANT